MAISGILTVKEAALLLGMGAVRLRLLVREGRIKATKHGNSWLVDYASLKRWKPRPSGSPGHFKNKKGAKK